MNDTLIPRQPKRKRQPTAECMREQLRLAADEIIRLRTLVGQIDDLKQAMKNTRGEFVRSFRFKDCADQKTVQQQIDDHVKNHGFFGGGPATVRRDEPPLRSIPQPPAPPPGRDVTGRNHKRPWWWRLLP